MKEEKAEQLLRELEEAKRTLLNIEHRMKRLIEYQQPATTKANVDISFINLNFPELKDTLLFHPKDRIRIIKFFKLITNSSLKEAKDFVDLNWPINKDSLQRPTD